MTLRIKTYVMAYAQSCGVKSALQVLPVKNLQPKPLRFLYRDALELNDLLTTNGTRKLSATEFEKLEEQTKLIKLKNFQGLDMFKNLSPEEKNKFLLNMELHELKQLLLVSTGNKPAVLLSDNYVDIKHPDYDMVRRTFKKAGASFDNTIILDKNAVKKVIGENFEIYQKRMGLDKNTTIEEIYSVLSGEKSPLKDELGYSDLVGLTLGYPRVNTLLYNLKQNFINLNANEQVTRLGLQKFLISNQSPYKNFSTKFKNELSEQIKKMNFSNNNIMKYITTDEVFPVYSFTAFVNEAEAFGKIIQSLRNTIKAVEKINADNLFCRTRNQVK